MEMKINRFTLIAISVALLAGSACSGKKPSATAPTLQKTAPPPIQAASKPSKPATSATVAVAKDPAPAAKPQTSIPVPAEAKPAAADPVADLIAKVEKDYQAGEQE